MNTRVARLTLALGTQPLAPDRSTYPCLERPILGGCCQPLPDVLPELFHRALFTFSGEKGLLIVSLGPNTPPYVKRKEIKMKAK